MKCLVSHITAFEYWRLVGLPGIVRPLPTNSQAIPSSMESDEIERLASMGPLPALACRNFPKKEKRIANLFLPLQAGALSSRLDLSD